MTLWALSATFMGIGYCAWMEWHRMEWKRLVYWTFFIPLFFIAFTRSGSDLPDYDTYLRMYLEPDWHTTEPTFVSLAYFARWAGDALWLFAVYACMGIYLKMLAIKRLVGYSFLALLIYVSKIYVLHDMIQMRVSIASGLFLLSIEPLYNRHYAKYMAYILCAVLFHYSAAVLLLLVLLPRKRFYGKVWMLLLGGCFCMYLHEVYISSSLSFIGFEVIQRKIELYSQIKGVQLDNISLPYTKVLVLGLLFVNFKQCCLKNRYTVLLAQIYILALCFYMLFFDVYELALRVSELLGVVDILLIPMLVYMFRPYLLSKMVVWGLACYLFYISMFSGAYFGYNL